MQTAPGPHVVVSPSSRSPSRPTGTRSRSSRAWAAGRASCRTPRASVPIPRRTSRTPRRRFGTAEMPAVRAIPAPMAPRSAREYARRRRSRRPIPGRTRSPSRPSAGTKARCRACGRRRARAPRQPPSRIQAPAVRRLRTAPALPPTRPRNPARRPGGYGTSDSAVRPPRLRPRPGGERYRGPPCAAP